MERGLGVHTDTGLLTLPMGLDDISGFAKRAGGKFSESLSVVPSA